MPTLTRPQGPVTGNRLFDEFVLRAPSAPVGDSPDFYDSTVRPALAGLRSVLDPGDDPGAQLAALTMPGSGGVARMVGLGGQLASRGGHRLAKSAMTNVERLGKRLATNSMMLFGRELYDKYYGGTDDGSK